MTALRSALAFVVAIAGGGHAVYAQASLPADFLCGAEASKKGLYGGHPKRSAYIAECIATKSAAKPIAPTPAAAPASAAKPVAPPTVPVQRPRAPIESAEQRRGKIAFYCGAAASKKGLYGGHPARKAFVDDCIRRSPPVKE